MPGKVQFLLEIMLKHMEHREVIKHSQHDFTEAKPCLADPKAFSNGMNASVDMKRARDAIYLDLCQAFDMVLHNFLSLDWRYVSLMDGLLD